MSALPVCFKGQGVISANRDLNITFVSFRPEIDSKLVAQWGTLRAYRAFERNEETGASGIGESHWGEALGATLASTANQSMCIEAPPHLHSVAWARSWSPGGGRAAAFSAIGAKQASCGARSARLNCARRRL